MIDKEKLTHAERLRLLRIKGPINEYLSARYWHADALAKLNDGSDALILKARRREVQDAKRAMNQALKRMDDVLEDVLEVLTP